MPPKNMRHGTQSTGNSWDQKR